jgi:L-alanine-DL-glutamate epimerase-like enolase superfamily enzyme
VASVSNWARFIPENDATAVASRRQHVISPFVEKRFRTLEPTLLPAIPRGRTMKIVDVKTQRLQLPFMETLATTYGARTHATIVLVSVVTDEGLTGYGESVGLFQETAEKFIETELRPLLMGEDPARVEYLVHKMEHLIEWNSFAAYPIAAIDVALHDLKAKALNIPVYELLGGLYRSDVQFDGLIHLHSPEQDASTAKRFVDLGYGTLKVKTGPDSALDMRRLYAIREAVGGDVRLRIDYNMALSPRTAIRAIQALAVFDLEYVEQPVPGWDIDGLAEVARGVSVPIAADESCQSVRDALRLVEKRACEVFCVYLSEAGGLVRAREIAAIANTGGISCVLGSWGEGGIGFAAGVHLAASSRNFDLVQGAGYQILTRDYVDRPFPINERGGLVAVPTGPGLGVEPDWELVRRECALVAPDAVFRAVEGGIPRFRRVLPPAAAPTRATKVSAG